jgi:hypothetical protein
METKDYLHKKFIHTNRSFPSCSYAMDYYKYPVQMQDVLNTEVELTYRYKDIYMQGYSTSRMPTSGRPEDDNQDVFDPRDSQEWEEKYTYTDTFRVLRADAEEPYKFVAMSIDCANIIVCDSRHWEETRCHIIPGQNKTYLGHMVKPYYIEKFDDEIFTFVESIPEMRIKPDVGYQEAYLYSADISEPGYCVVLTYWRDDRFKIYLDDECLLELLDSPDLDDLRKNMKKFRKLIMGDRLPYGI